MAHVLRRHAVKDQISDLSIWTVSTPVILVQKDSTIVASIHLRGRWTHPERKLSLSDGTPIALEDGSGNFTITIFLLAKINQFDLVVTDPVTKKAVSETLYVYAPPVAEPYFLRENYDIPKVVAQATYPLFTSAVSFSPELVKVSEKLLSTGDNLKLTGDQIENLSFVETVQLSPRWLLRANLEYLNFQSPDLVLGPYTAIAGQESNLSYFLGGSYCLYSGAILARICPGLDYGIVQFPVYAFGTTNGNLSLSRAQDSIFGLRIDYQHETATKAQVLAAIAYRQNMGSSSAATVRITEDHIYRATLGFQWPINDFNRISVSGAYMLRSADFQNAGNLWSTSIQEVVLRLGYSISTSSF